MAKVVNAEAFNLRLDRSIIQGALEIASQWPFAPRGQDHRVSVFYRRMEPFRQRHATTLPALGVRLQPLRFIVPDFGHENHAPVKVHALTLQPDSLTPPKSCVGTQIGEVAPCGDEVRA